MIDSEIEERQKKAVAEVRANRDDRRSAGMRSRR